MLNKITKQWQQLSWKRRAMTLALVTFAAGAGLYGFAKFGGTKTGHSEVSS